MSDTPRPKPAPPKTKVLGVKPSFVIMDEVQESDTLLQDIRDLQKSVVWHSDREIVDALKIEIKDTMLAEHLTGDPSKSLKPMVKKIFDPGEHLTDRPLQNHPALLALKADLKPEQQREVKRVTKPFKRSFKKRSNSK